MIKRIVKLVFKEGEVENFKKIFSESKSKIRGFEGCHHVELLQARDEPYIFFTLSIWENEEALNRYRHSELFQSTWKKTKALFNDKPLAWSVDKIAEG